MRLLLDTHVLLWALSDEERLGAKVQAELHRSQVWASAASIWEIAIKYSAGKLPVDPEEVLAALEPAGFLLLPVQGSHAARMGSLGAFHGDPFDRLLVAQAREEGLVLFTNDEALVAYGNCVRLMD